jgi:hypothetical protein
MADDAAYKRFFFDAQRRNFSRCMPPTLACNEKPIRAHSIQNARVIELIQSDGHVMMPRYRIKDDKPVLELVKISRNEASTFTGLCGTHDREIFNAIDTKPLDARNDEQLTLTAYRSVMREMHTLTEEAGRMWWIHDAWVRGGLASINDITVPLVAGTDLYRKAQVVFRYRSKYFDTPSLQGKKVNLVHFVRELSEQSPVIAVSSLFSTGFTEIGDIIGPTFNVIPVAGNKTLIILSYPKDQEKSVATSLDKILKAGDDKLKYEISKLIIQRVENFVLSPAHYASWSSAKTKLILSEFERSLGEAKEIKDAEDLFLF